MFDGPGLPMSILFVSVAAIFVLRGPFGRALADRLAGRRAPDDGDVQELRGEVEALRQEVPEVHERLDFAERMLARQDEGALPPAGKPGHR